MRKVYVGLLPPVIQDKVIDYSGLQAITLRNAGTATAHLNNGMYTLAPGESVSLSAIDNADELIVAQISINFDTSTGAVKKVQLLTLRVGSNIC